MCNFKEKIYVIKGQNLKHISRAGSMVNIGVGEMVKHKVAHKEDNGKISVKEVLAPKYALHIDSFFRIYKENELLIAKGDMFCPCNEIEQGKDFDIDNFDWEKQGSNALDAKIKEYLSSEDLIVQEILLNDFNDLKMVFTNGICIEIFADCTEEQECWRFFEVGNSDKKHIVATGKGIFEE